MPSWAVEDPDAYWDAADLHERANERLYVAADFALPRGLSAEDQAALAHDFAAELTRDETLPRHRPVPSRDARAGQPGDRAPIAFGQRAETSRLGLGIRRRHRSRRWRDA